MARKRRSQDREKVRYAVVGLGWFAQVAVLPAFAHAGANSELVALFSDTPEKLRKLGRKYGVERLHSHEEFDAELAAGGIHAVYLVVPNHLHRDYTLRAAEAGVHVLCEKPMAVTEDDCLQMIEASRRAGVRLAVAYRLHFERANLEAVEIVRSGRIGESRIFNSVFTYDVRDAGNIRLGPIEKGGGALYDIGIYCINAARYLFRSEPIEVSAIIGNSGEKRFRGTTEGMSAILKFPRERLAAFTTRFGAASAGMYEIYGTKGQLRVEPAYEFAGKLGHRLTVGGRTRERAFRERDQIAPEILDFSSCILTGREPENSGREGLADVRIIRALYRSAAERTVIRLPPFEKKSRPSKRQERRRPAGKEPKLVEAAEPSAG